MLEVLPRIPLYQMYRRFGWPRPLPINLTLTPSPRCNSKCLTCNIWKKREDELTLEEWEKIFQSLGRAPFWVTISGGEPFLHSETVEIIQALYHYCRPAIINIPHNSLLERIIAKRVAAVAERCPEAQIIVNLSLDGVGEQHDRIRGVAGNFAKFEATYRALVELDYPNLAIGIHTVISRFNVGELDAVFDYALGLTPDSYITEIAEERVELGTVGAGITPAPDEYGRAIDNLIARLRQRNFGGISQITQAFRLEYYQLVKRILAEQRQVVPCYAGWASAQIYANGDVWPCCMRADKMSNLRQVDYDFKRAWFSPEAERIRRSIYAQECHCPLANASYTNMLHNYFSLGRVAWKVASAALAPQRPAPGVAAQPGRQAALKSK
jgi:MoaA/NifB/PqqE/SkfB family radical SAM enzyme